jgi:hypothetical protein
MGHFELRRSGYLVVWASLIVVLLVSSPILIDQDESSVPLPHSHGAILEQALEPDLKDTKNPSHTVLSTVETAVVLLAYAQVRDQVPQQSYQPIEQSSLSVFQRCSTYRI